MNKIKLHSSLLLSIVGNGIVHSYCEWDNVALTIQFEILELATRIFEGLQLVT